MPEGIKRFSDGRDGLYVESPKDLRELTMGEGESLQEGVSGGVVLSSLEGAFKVIQDGEEFRGEVSYGFLTGFCDLGKGPPAKVLEVCEGTQFLVMEPGGFFFQLLDFGFQGFPGLGGFTYLQTFVSLLGRFRGLGWSFHRRSSLGLGCWGGFVRHKETFYILPVKKGDLG
jgi:hypothetical protein